MNKSAQYNLLRYYLMQKLAAECDCGMDEESCDCEECSKEAFLGLFSSDSSPNEISFPNPDDESEVEIEKSLKNLGFTDIERHIFTPYVDPFTAKGSDGKYYTIDLDEDENVWRAKSISDVYGVDSVKDLPDPYNRSEPGLVVYASKKANSSLLAASLLKWAASSPAWQRSEGRASYKKATDGQYEVPSHSVPGRTYTITVEGPNISCTCLGFKFRGYCKHVTAARSKESGWNPFANANLDEKLLKWAASSPAWQRSEGKNPEGGLNAKGRASYNKATGGNLKPPVSAEAAEKSPAKAKRRSSFCARSDGQRRMHNIDCSATPDKRICLARKKWDC